MAYEVEGASGRTTVHALEIDLADGQRSLWRTLTLRTARHPDESAEYFATRLLAWALYWSPDLKMRDGPCHGNEPCIWEDDPLAGRPRIWIDVGLPDPERLRHALSRSDEVALFACPANETILALVRAKHFAGKRVPRVFILPQALVEGAATHLDRRLEWYLQRDGDELLLALPGGSFEGTLVEVQFAGRVQR